MSGKFVTKTHFLTDTGGNVMPLAAVGLLVMAALIGGGVDMSRAYRVQSRLQAACDAGVLAGRKAVSTNGFSTAVRDKAKAYFNANFDPSEQDAHTPAFTLSSPDNGKTINGAATTIVDTAIMKIFGYNTMDLSVSCTASMGVGNSDVTMVLDTTGSMSQAADGSSPTSTKPSKISALRIAMKNFYDTVAAQTSGGNARIRYAFVPYSSSVNVGKLLYDIDPDYLADSNEIQSREAKWKKKLIFDHWGDPTTTTADPLPDTPVYSNRQKKTPTTSYNSSNSCKNNKPSDTAWVNSGFPTSSETTQINQSGQQVTTTTQTQVQTSTHYTCESETVSGNTKWYVFKYDATRNDFSYIYNTRNPVYVESETEVEFNGFTYKKVAWPVSSYKSGGALSYLDDSGNTKTTTWDGCIEERDTVPQAASAFLFSDGTISPSGATDLNIDSPPDPGDPKTQWRPMVGKVAYLRGYYSGGFKPQNVLEYTSGAQPGSLFYVCPRAAQSLQSMAQADFYAYANSLTTGGSTWHDIGAIWGARLSSPDGIFADTVNIDPPNGGSVSRHLIFMTDGEMNADNLIYSSYGIEFHDKRTSSNGSSNMDAIHTARFLAVCEAIKAKGIRIWVIAFGTGLTSDLSTCASDDSAMAASDPAGLDQAFQDIAKKVGELRITQ